MTLAEVLDAAADTAEGSVEADTADDGSITWSLGGRPFATLDAAGTTASFGLDQVIADAARRTPDTHHSDRGGTWVAFRPAELDGHAADRARAWFLAAARRATT